MGPVVIGRGNITDVQGFLNGRKRDFGRVFDLLGIVRHVQSEPSLCLLRNRTISRAPLAISGTAASLRWSRKRGRRPLVCDFRKASYWLGDANEMPAINTILIIVNSEAR